jgi:flavin-dependent dehydrogenase
VGGGPAGTATAIRLARAGVDTALFERAAAPQWRACGVYTSPLTRGGLTEIGLEEAELDALLRPVPAMVVETIDGATCELDYRRNGSAWGADRVRLDAAMLARAREAGADVRERTTVRSIEPGTSPFAVDGNRGRMASVLEVSGPTGVERWSARIVVGADGPGSLVARAFGVQRSARHLRRAGLTAHVREPRRETAADEPRMAYMVIGRGWYCGLCPVPGGRVNVGIVIGERHLRQALSRGDRPAGIVRRILGALPPPHASLAAEPIEDHVAVALPLANRVARRSGPGFLLVGDAQGFVDPLSGEGLHRALVSAELAAAAVVQGLGTSREPSFDDYDRRLRARFRRKDLLSWVLQACLAEPRLLGYAVRRLDSRPGPRHTFAGVMADLLPARRAFEPGFLGELFRP